MIKFLKGNLLQSNAQALVNTVNTVGVMGKGIALQFKQHFPHNYKVYKNAVKPMIIESLSELDIDVCVYEPNAQIKSTHIIDMVEKLNPPTLDVNLDLKKEFYEGQAN